VKLAQAFIIFDRLLIEQRNRGLEPIEREILTAAWENAPYQSIHSYQEQTVKNKAAHLWKELSQLLGFKISKQNIAQILTTWDNDPNLSGDRPHSATPYRTRFFGRLSELIVLRSAIELSRQKLIWLYGMPGIGKTALIQQFIEQYSSKFDRIVWISLKQLTPLIDTLEIVITELDGSKPAKTRLDMLTAIEKTIGSFQAQRCLLIFDNADTIFNAECPNSSDIRSEYLKFFDRLELFEHQSFCITISNTKPTQIISKNRSLELHGLDRHSCQNLLEYSDLIGTDSEWDLLVRKYRGNPQHLKLIANTIRDIFNRSIRKFLDANILVYDRIETELSTQINALSPSETAVLNYLASQPEPIALARSIGDLQHTIADTNIIKIFDKLVGRYLIDAHDGHFSLPESIGEYIRTSYLPLL
jgi:ATPase family associated with various cellular activities (AAA)